MCVNFRAAMEMEGEKVERRWYDANNLRYDFGLERH